MLQKSRFNQFKRKIYQINAQIVTKIILSKVFWKMYWTSSGEQDTNKVTVCGHRYSLKGSFQNHIRAVHENNIPYKCTICEQNYPLIGTLKNILNQFLTTIYHKTAQFVVTIIVKKVLWKYILNQFMTVIYHINAKLFVF